MLHFEHFDNMKIVIWKTHVTKYIYLHVLSFKRMYYYSMWQSMWLCETIHFSVRFFFSRVRFIWKLLFVYFLNTHLHKYLYIACVSLCFFCVSHRKDDEFFIGCWLVWYELVLIFCVPNEIAELRGKKINKILAKKKVSTFVCAWCVLRMNFVFLPHKKKKPSEWKMLKVK